MAKTGEKFFANRAAREVGCAARTMINYAKGNLVPHEIIDGVHVFTRESIERAREIHQKNCRRRAAG